MDVVEVAQGFLQYGVVGLVALMALLAYNAERKENKQLRDRLEQAAKVKGDTSTEQATKFAERIETISSRFAEHVSKIDQQHHAQEDELTDRLVDATRTYAENNTRVLDKLTIFIDSVRERNR